MNRAFSLVELSIVLVILGLLVGGILAGQSLIRAAELRSVGTDLTRFQTAVHSFRDKYFAIPGDMDNATLVWGKDNTNCAAHTGTAATPGTCNGNNDRMITTSLEVFQFWKQLALAGLVEGSYTGITGAGGASHAVPGTNVPAGRLTSSGYNIGYWVAAGDVNNFAMDYGNFLLFGGATTTTGPNAGILKTEELWNIDTKIDDGKPGRGRLISIYWDTCTDAATFSSLDANYALNDTTSLCALRFRNIAQ